jgi:aminoglycoside phosphotransferase (APT) family kinase protein
MTEQLEGLIDVAALERFIRTHLPPQEGELVVEKHEAGYSNETFYVSWGPKRWVMRRPPRGDILPTAHDMLREYRVLSALVPTGVRVPRPVVACEDRSVIGVPFYLMERVEGTVIREQLPPEFAAMADRQRIGDEVIDALVELHAVDWRASSLATLGKPQGFLERQLRRWTGQLDLTLPHTRQLLGIHEVTSWLQAHLPPQSDTSVVHGDYKLDNVMFAARPPITLVAIFDWEMATLGDPLADLGWVLSFWGPTGDPPEPEPKGSNFITEQPGFRSREELAAKDRAQDDALSLLPLPGGVEAHHHPRRAISALFGGKRRQSQDGRVRVESASARGPGAPNHDGRLRERIRPSHA